MAATIELSDLDKYSANIYEAIVIIARRAGQVNEEQKQILERESEIFDEDDEFDDEGITIDLVDRKYIRLPKPTQVALEEMLAGKLTHEYLNEAKDRHGKPGK